MKFNKLSDLYDFIISNGRFLPLGPNSDLHGKRIITKTYIYTAQIENGNKTVVINLKDLPLIYQACILYDTSPIEYYRGYFGLMFDEIEALNSNLPDIKVIIN